MKKICNKHEAGLGCLVVLLGLALIVALAAFEAWLVMVLWNAVLCAIFPTIPTINFWLAWGGMILCNLLFKSHVTVNKN